MKETGIHSNLQSNEAGPDLRGRFVAGSEFSLPSTAQIARRAYSLYMDSSAVHGNDVEHWLLAEKQLQTDVTLRTLRPWNQ